MRIKLIWALLALIFVLKKSEADLIPYGKNAGDQQLDFASSSGIALTVPVPYFDEPQSELFISPKGAISFGKKLDDSEVVNLEENAGNNIAVLYGKAVNGLVYYRTESPESNLATELTGKVQRTFSDASSFKPRIVLIVTWERQIAGGSGENNFQLVLLSDARVTYALLNFDKIEWTNSEGVFSQSGFFFKDGRNMKNINSGTDGIRDLVKLTNYNKDGSFLFRVSGPDVVDPREGGPNDDYEYGNEKEYDSELNDENDLSSCPKDPYKDHCPDTCKIITDDRGCSLCICPARLSQEINTAVENELGDEVQLPPADPIVEQAEEVSPVQDNPQIAPFQNTPIERPTEGTCDSANLSPVAPCHKFASCVDYDTGFCCYCAAGHFGNGKDYLPEESQQRINGFFEGAINGKSIPKTDIYTFVQTRDGQQHTAIAKLPPELANSILLLDTVGSIMGWLFAKRGSDNAYNGFELTGGVFNRTVNIHLGDRSAILIKQEFTGRKNQDYIDVNVFASGTLPDLAPGSEVFYENYMDSYKRERPGLIRSYTEREIRIRENQAERKIKMTVDQQIHYTECRHKEFDKSEVIKIRVTRLNAHLTPNDNLVRFASQSVAVDPNDEPSDPSRGVVAQGVPIVQGSNPVEAGVCATGSHLCTLPHMLCEPAEQSYRCVCETGYQPEIDDSVPIRFRCVLSPQQPSANIRPVVEQPIGPGFCTTHRECHQWGECVFGENGQGRCKCRGWYVGDGVSHCGPPEQAQQPPRPPVYEHSPLQTVGGVCRSHSECGEHGNCVYNVNLGHYKCECIPPYKGDGISCTEEVRADSCENKLGCDVNARCVYDPSRSDSICQCVDGFEGDGRFCTPRNAQAPIVRPPENNEQKTECRDQTECHQNAHCIQSESNERYYCECLPGFRGNGIQSCVSADQCNPSSPNPCNAHAECVYGYAEQAYVCKCIQGFTGDGVICTAHAQATTCDQEPNICHHNAECSFDVKASRYECKCKPGSTGDGYQNCVVESGCYENRSLCHENAQCILGEHGHYVCNCKYGYHGNGLVCHPDSESRPDTLLIGRGMSIISRPTAPEVVGRQLVVVPHQVVVDVDYDCTTERIYWSDISNHVIRSASLNGTEQSSFLESELKSPEGIAIDWSSRNLYYVDSIKDEIGVMSIDGKYQKTLVKEGLTNPRALEIDLIGRKLYYSDWHRENPFIGRVDLDGKNNEVFVNQDIHLPNGLAIVQSTKELCWVDAGSQRLSCIGLDGSHRRLVYAPLEYPFGLAVRNDERFYWTDWKDHQVHTVSIAGHGYTAFPPSVGGGGKIYGLTVPSKCQGTPSACATNNGGCNYLCLPGRHAVQCVCPDNVLDLEGCP